VPIEITETPFARAFFTEYRDCLDGVLGQTHKFDLPGFYEKNINFLLSAVDENIECEKKLVDMASKTLATTEVQPFQETIFDYLASYTRLSELNHKVHIIELHSSYTLLR
jgi:hypothetical protein